jgi:hypothetical protein
MIDFVLEYAGLPAFRLHAQRLATAIQPRDDDLFMAIH